VPGTVSQKMLETLKGARHVAVDERDPDACVHRKTTVLSSEHVGGRISVEEPLYAEPPHDTTAHLLGERGQISLGEKAEPAAIFGGRLARRRAGGPSPVGTQTPSVARGSQVHVVIERRSEAVQTDYD